MVDEAIKRMRRVVERQEKLAANLDEHVRELGQGYEDMRLVIDEIDSLRRQLAEARRNAVPWRDGPARGGEMPLPCRSIVIESEYNGVEAGYLKTHETGRTTFVRPSGSEAGRRINRYFYVADLPATAEGSGVAGG